MYTAFTTSFILLARYLSIIPGIDETALANRFVCLNSEKSSSKDFTLSSNLNKEPKVGRFCREVLEALFSVETMFFVAELNERNSVGVSVVIDNEIRVEHLGDEAR
ncbi:hypothetical protein Tco_0290624 [Tanacetum coccineum]